MSGRKTATRPLGSYPLKDTEFSGVQINASHVRAVLVLSTALRKLGFCPARVAALDWYGPTETVCTDSISVSSESRVGDHGRSRWGVEGSGQRSQVVTWQEVPPSRRLRARRRYKEI